MCGIAGLWAPKLDPNERRRHVEGMLRRLTHRGPDGFVTWSGAGVTLGLARLAIVAPEHPASVSVNEAGTVAAVANGEIYNYRDLQSRLAARGFQPADGPDTMVLPHLYEDAGAEFVSQLDGMFAIAVWDAPRERLVLARDRAGEKPLYVAGSHPRFAFASEPAALLGLPWVGRDPAPAAIARYLVHGFFGNGDSAFSALHQIPAGHVLEVGPASERVRRYWRPWDGLLTARRPAGDREMVTETRNALATAVESRLPSDVPFGVFLSGGLDSSLVAALAARTGRSFPTFSLHLPGKGYDESAHAREVARTIGSEHHEVSIDDRNAEELLDRIEAGMDQPLGDPSLLPTWALSRFASQHVRVVLTGEGGDELFAGYPTYLGHRLAGVANRIPLPVAAALRSLTHRLTPRDTHVSIPHLVERLLSVRDLTPLERHVEWFGTLGRTEVPALLSEDLRTALDPGDTRANFASVGRALDDIGGAKGSNPSLLVYQLLDFELYLSGGLLVKVDRATMAHGLESRAPFLHHPLVEYAMALPSGAKLRGTTGKWVLKRAAEGLLPKPIIYRRKQGFAPPFSSWVRGPLRGLVLSKLEPRRVGRAGVLDPAGVLRILKEHLLGEAEHGRAIWAILCLQLWAERWLLGSASDTESDTEIAAHSLGHS